MTDPRDLADLLADCPAVGGAARRLGGKPAVPAP
jgi:hypothetical protein